MDFNIHYEKRKNSELFKSIQKKAVLNLSSVQNYIPIYNKFFSLNEKNYNSVNLNNEYYIENIVGKFEDKKYAKGTLAITKAIIDSGAFSVVGGGETVEFLNKQGIIDKFSHVSTGGGAMLSYLAGDKLPGLVALGK